MWLSLFSLYVMMWRMMERIDVTVNNEGNGKDDGHIRKRPQTPTPLRYCGQIIVDKSIGVNVLNRPNFSWKGTPLIGGRWCFRQKGTPTKGGQVCN